MFRLYFRISNITASYVGGVWNQLLFYYATLISGYE